MIRINAFNELSSVSNIMSNYSIRNFAQTTGRYLKFLGLSTFTLRNEKILVTPFDITCLSFNLILGFYVFHLSLAHGVDQLTKSSVLLATGTLLTTTSGSVVILVSMVSVFCHRHRIWRIVLLLDGALEKFKRIHVVADFKHYIVMYVVFSVMAIVLVFAGIFVMAVWLGYSEKPAVLFIFFYLSIIFSASMGWSALFPLAIYIRLNLINQTIR